MTLIPEARNHRIATGPAAAAMIAAGIGCFTLGMLVILAHVSPAVAQALDWYLPAGPLSGKTGVAIGVWILTWFALDRLWARREVDLGGAWRWTMVLVGSGFLATFPPFFDLFG